VQPAACAAADDQQVAARLTLTWQDGHVVTIQQWPLSDGLQIIQSPAQAGAQVDLIVAQGWGVDTGRQAVHAGHAFDERDVRKGCADIGRQDASG